MPEATKIELTRDVLDSLLDEVKEAAFDGIASVIEAHENGDIDSETRNELAEEIVSDLVESLANFADDVFVLPEPAEALSDAALEAAKDAATGPILRGLQWVGRGIRELLDRDAPRLIRRIRRKETAVAEAKTSKRRRAREKDLERLQTLLAIHFPDEAEDEGFRLEDGALIFDGE